MPALILIIFCTALGALLGSWLTGLVVGSGLVLIATYIDARRF